ncbi:MAG: PD-(D/E)XK nuclease superfamily protein [Caldisericia bacterium]
MINDKIIISAKWQQVKGTAEQKILYDIISLIKIIIEYENKFLKGYVVIGGEGFSEKAREFLLSQSHKKFLKDGEKIEILTIDRFVALANNKNL